MDVYEAIEFRKTIRNFSNKPVPDDILFRIINAGFKAPTNNHLRDWHFVLLDDLEKRDEILLRTIKPISGKGALGMINCWQLNDTCQRDMYLDAIPKQITMLREAPCLMLPCYHQDGSVLKPKTLSDLNSFASIWMCIENILIAAAAEGIFGVTRIPGETERKEIKEFCHIPNSYIFPCLLALGYPAENALRPSQVEIKLADRIHCDTW